jgi:hypothetical protein
MKCEICKKELDKTKNQNRFCSRGCLHKYMSVDYKKRKILPPNQSGIKWTTEQKNKLKQIRLKQPNSMKRPEIVAKAQAKKKITYDLRGRKATLSERIRKSPEYKLWRTAVYERDNYTCIWCGIKGNKLNADHIKPFAQFPELRFAIDNGRTLCVDCHRKTDTYGWRSVHKKAWD